MDARAIHALVARLARPHGKGEHIVEGAAIRAEGSDFDAIEAWILGRGGKPEAEPPRPPARGLYASRFEDTDAQRNLATSRYVLPAGALDDVPDEEPGAARGDERAVEAGAGDVPSDPSDE